METENKKNEQLTTKTPKTTQPITETPPPNSTETNDELVKLREEVNRLNTEMAALLSDNRYVKEKLDIINALEEVNFASKFSKDIVIEKLVDTPKELINERISQLKQEAPELFKTDTKPNITGIKTASVAQKNENKAFNELDKIFN
jgi:hypothetical protein